MFRQVVREHESVVKTYLRGDTARFKWWGSGVANERLVDAVIAGICPRVLAVWETPTAEHVRLEWVEGDELKVSDDDQIVEAGRLLGRIHGCTAASWGALDASIRFDDPRDALMWEAEAAGRLLESHAAGSGVPLVRRCRELVAEAECSEPPTLVHGDFAPPNLIQADGDLRVLDWEHARWGHPLEDWGHIRIGLRFREPNSFADTWGVLDLLSAGWRETAGRDVPIDPALDHLLELVYAASLGVFFDEEPNERLLWLEEALR